MEVLLLVLASLIYANGQTNVVELEFTLIEEQTANTLVGDIVTSAGLPDRLSQATLDTLTYEFLNPSQLVRSHFVVESNGLLRTSRTLDRDSVCKGSEICDISLDIGVKPVEHFLIVKVKIHLIDINDNQPEFSRNEIAWPLSETAMPGTTFAISLAQDPDSPSNGIQSYELQGNRDVFKLRVTKDSTGHPSDVHLVLQQAINREHTESYNLVLTAYDGGTPRRSGSVEIKVNIMDVNDNAPQFDNKTYNVVVYENVSIGATVATVHATDIDAGENGQVQYELSENSARELGDMFEVQKDTGHIIVQGHLDSDQGQDEYVLALVAKDAAVSPLADYAKVIIKVQDINDHSPQVTINSLTPSGVVEIPENSPLGTFVTHISVQDPDKGKNGQFTCSLDNPNFELHQLYVTEFKITSTAVFDRETLDQYDVNLICTDEGAPSKTTTEVIKVSVGDRNDFAPEFPQDTYYVTFRENNTLGDEIIRLNASDNDIGDNALIEYQIANLGGFPNSLSIDPQLGIVRATSVFDYEMAPRYEYIVTATDKGDPAKSSTATLSISLSDINDNPPVFKKDYYRFGTYENQPAGTEIGTVKATDADGPRNNQVTYEIDYTQGERAEVFKIDTWTGKITAQRVLDQESVSAYRLVVIARNHGYSISSSVNVSIDVADRNDNAPIIIFPIDDNTTVYVNSNAEKGHIISHIEAFDLDLGVNALLRYEIVSGNRYGLFDIHPIDGSLVVNSPLDKQSDKSFNLGILVSDKGTPPMSAVTRIRINIRSSTSAFSKGFSGLNDEVLIIIVAGIVALMLVCGLILLVLLVRRHHRRQAKYSEPMDTLDKPPESIMDDDEGTVAVNKEEITFRPNDGVIQNRFFDSSPWPHMDLIQDPHGHSTPLTRHPPCAPPSPGSGSEGNRSSSPAELPPPFLHDSHNRLYYTEHPTLPVDRTPAQLQAQDLLQLLPPAGDASSDRGSLTDSGRGVSEEGDHHSPQSESTGPRRPSTISPNVPSRFTIYPPTSHRKQLPSPHHAWNPISYNDLRRQDSQKPDVPPRTSSVPKVPPREHKLKTFCPVERDPPPPRPPKKSPSRSSVDYDDDATTTSGSYVVDLSEVAEADNIAYPEE